MPAMLSFGTAMSQWHFSQLVSQVGYYHNLRFGLNNLRDFEAVGGLTKTSSYP